MDRKNRRRVSVSLNIRIMMFSPHMFPLHMFFFLLAGYADKFRQERDQVVFVHVYESPITPAPTFASKNVFSNHFYAVQLLSIIRPDRDVMKT